MQHVDEGMIHMFLDGELSPAEKAEFERHLSVCAPCRAKLAEERGILNESDGLIVALDNVAPGTRPATTVHQIRRPRPWYVRPAALAWAASIVVAAGIGYTWRGTPEAHPFIAAETDVPSPPPAQEPAAKSTAPVAPPATNAAPRRLVSDGRRDVAATPEAPAPAQEELHLAAGGQPATAAGAAAAGTSAADAEPRPAALNSTSRAYAQTEAAPSYAYQQGVPVDTSPAAVAGRLAFGPATTAEPKRITLDEAVTLLGGSIQLIDGLTPQRVEVLAGLDVAGADPNRQVVRIYYEEPDLGLVTLDQQRPGPSFDAMRRGESEPPTVTLNPTAPSATRARSAMTGSPLATTIWRHEGVWLALTTRLPADRMAALQARVK